MNGLRKCKLILGIFLIVGLISSQSAYGQSELISDQEQDHPTITKEEIPELRTEYSKTYKTDQPGVFVSKVFNEQAHYQSDDGQYYDISSDLIDEKSIDTAKHISKEGTKKFKDEKKKKQENSGKIINSEDNESFYALHLPFAVTLPKIITTGYSIGKGKDNLTFIPQNAKAIKGKKDPDNTNAMLYMNVWESTNIRLSVTSTGVKEDIVMLNDNAPNSFSFEVQGKLDKELHSGDLSILPAWLVDSDGQRRDVRTTKRNEGNKTFLDLTWDNVGLTYPVTIDPSVNGNMSIAYYSCSNTPSTLTLGIKIGSESNMGTCMSFIQFSNFQLPSSAQVTNVDLSITGNNNGATFPVTVRQLFMLIPQKITYSNPPVQINSISVTNAVANTTGSSGQSFEWNNLDIDTKYVRTGMIQLGLYYSGNTAGMLITDNSSLNDKTFLRITYTDNPNNIEYQYDRGGRLTSIRSSTGHLVGGSIYDKNGNMLKRLNPYFTLLENHDFREGAEMWQMGDMSITNEKSVDGNSSLVFKTLRSTGTQSITQHYPILTNSGNNYTLSTNILDNTTSGSFYVTWQEYNPYYGLVASGSKLLAPIKGQWSIKSVSFTTSMMTSWISVQIVADTGTIGEAYVDNIRLTPGIINGSFTNGTTGWSASSYFTSDTSYYIDSNTSLKFSNSSNSVNASTYNLKSIPVNSGASYSMSTWVNNGMTSNGSINILVRELSVNNTIIKDNYFDISEQRGTRTWFNKSFTLATDSRTRYVTVQLNFLNAQGNVNIDQLVLALNT